MGFNSGFKGLNTHLHIVPMLLIPLYMFMAWTWKILPFLPLLLSLVYTEKPL